MKKLNFKKLLITGGTGSFGQTFLFKAINEFDYTQIRVLVEMKKSRKILEKKSIVQKLNFTLVMFEITTL